MQLEEVLFERVISDAQNKGAQILSWNRSKNGRIVLYSYDDLPKYFINLAWAIDSLIYRYNLKNYYQSIHEANVSKVNFYPSSTSMDTLESHLVYKLDTLLLQDDLDFTDHSKYKIFDTIHKIYSGHTFTYKEFTLITYTLSNHYLELASKATNLTKRKYLNQIVRFFQTISFSDINSI